MLVLFMLQFCGVSAQQKELKFRNFTQEDGLPSNEAYAVFRDSRNYIWMATDQGVVRYNGKVMEHYSLPDNVVFKIREDSRGRIWFFSHSGKLSYFFNEKIYPYKYNDSIAKISRSLLITDAYVANDGKIWINSADGEYMNYNISPTGVIEKFIYYKFTPFGESEIMVHRTDPNFFFARKELHDTRDKTINIIVEGDQKHPRQKYVIKNPGEQFTHMGCLSKNGYLYIFTGKVINRLNPDGTVLTKRFPADILCIQSSGENIWVGTIKNGAALLDKDLVPVDPAVVLDGLSVTSIAIDYENGTWFSTLERGIFYVKNIQVYNLKGSGELEQLISRMVNVNDKELIFSNEHGIYKMENNKVSELLPLKNDNVADMFLDEKKRLYVGCKQTTLDIGPNAKKIKVNDHAVDTVITILSSSEMKLISEYQIYNLVGHLIQMFDLSKSVKKGVNITPVFNNTVSVNGNMFFVDSRNTAWFGTTKNLYTVNQGFDSLIPFKSSSPIFENGVTQMRELSNGLYCIGLRNGGIVLMKDTTIIGEIKDKDGLLSNSVRYILPQGNMLWVATANGVSAINVQSYQPLSYTIRNIGKNEGLSNVVIKQLVPFQGNILVATSSGIFVIENADNFLQKKDPVIPLYIQSVNYYLGDTTGIQSITVPYNKNRLKIGLSAISFNSPEQIQYFYRFQKGDTTWQELAGSELLLENLPSGSYDLELKAGILNQKRFSAIEKFGITIEAPWWQNGWLQLAALAVLLTGVLVIYKIRIRAITKKANLRTTQKTKMLELEQTALRSQMNPHFIFNSLTSIQQLIVTNKAEQANEHLVKFARLIRKTLELSARPYIRISEEKEYLREYLVLEQMRIPGEFEFTIRIDERIDIFHTDIPNMMIQPIVENCIRHGIKHLETRKGLITILMELTGTVIRCTVTDNGIGRNHSPQNQGNMFFRQKSYGMEIVRKRLELLPGAEERSTVPEITDLYDENGKPSGTRVSIELPFKIITP